MANEYQRMREVCQRADGAEWTADTIPLDPMMGDPEREFIETFTPALALALLDVAEAAASDSYHHTWDAIDRLDALTGGKIERDPA